MVKRGEGSSESSVSKKKKMTAREREELLIENFVGLQHAMTNLSIRFEGLSNHIVKLLGVFEEAARGYVGGVGGDKDMLDKINSLIEQNKTIAKGLVLVESKIRRGGEPMNPPRAMPQRMIPQNSSQMPSMMKTKPLPKI